MDESKAEWRRALPYILPMAGFLALTSVEGSLPHPGGRPDPFWYPAVYAAKVAVVAILAWACRSSWRDLGPRPTAPTLALAVALGLAVTALWVGLDGLYPGLPLVGGGTRTAFDPNALRPAPRWAFIAVRFLGLAVLVPLIEELFWRSFLIRWLIDPDFARVPVGRVTPMAAGISSACFALAHPEWLLALITGLAWAWLLWKSKSLMACVISHAVANLALGLYVIGTGNWKYW